MDRQEIVQKYVTMYKAAYEFGRTINEQRLRGFNLYMGKVAPKKYKSEANFHVPYCATLLMNVLPILTGSLPESQIQPRNADRDRNAARLMEALIEYCYSVNKYELTFINWVHSAMLYGSAWLKIVWDWQDAETDHPSIVPLDTFDVFPHPMKITLDDNWPIFIRSEMTKADMIAKGWDKRSINTLGPSNLKSITYRRQRLQALGRNTSGYTANPDYADEAKKEDDIYEVVEVYGKMDLSFKANNPDPQLEMGYLVIGNGLKLLNTKPAPGMQPFQSPYTHKKIPLAHLAYETVPDLLLGQSFLDPILEPQEELNALVNMKMDNYKRRNNPPLKIRRAGNVDLTTLHYATSAPWMVNDEADIMPFELPDLSPSITADEDGLKQLMQARTGANDVLLVTDDTTLKGGDSATGAAIANDNTKSRFSPQTLRIDLGNERLGEILINLYQDKRFFDTPKAVAIADQDGNFLPQLVSFKDVQGDLQFKVTSGSSIADSPAMKFQKAVNVKELYAEDPTINQDELDKPIFDNSGYNFNKVKKSTASMIQPLQQQANILIATINSPDFHSMPAGQQQQLIEHLKAIQSQLQQLTAGQQQPMQTPAETQPQTVSAEGGMQA